MRYVGFTLCSLLLLVLCAPGFQRSTNAKKPLSRMQSDFSVRVNAIVVKVTVTDKAGKPVTDLSAKDFRVYDDGTLQGIDTFALESFGLPGLEEARVPGASQGQHVKQENVVLPRLISIVMDDLTMESPEGRTRPGSILDFPRMIDAAKEFVKRDMRATDQVSLLSGSRKFQFPFSDSKNQLLEELDGLSRKLNLNWAYKSTDPELTDLEAWMISHNEVIDLPFADVAKAEWKRAAAIRQSADSEFRTRNLLYTIRQHLHTLRHFEGPKMVVLFSDGFLSETGTVEAYQLQELINLALRFGIILNCISTRGISMEGGGLIELDRMAQEKPLAQLASETGGQFFPTSNDMYSGLQNIAIRRSAHYVLTYGMPPHRPDNVYHHIKVEVTRPDLELSYRRGYYAPKEELTFENSKKEDLIEALNAPGDINEIPMTIGYNYFQEDGSTYAVSFLTTVDIRDVKFPKENDRRKNQISLVLVAFDEGDRYISGIEKSMDFQLMESSYAGLKDRGLKSRVELKLPLGRYKIRGVVRESAQGKMGSVTKSVEIP